MSVPIPASTKFTYNGFVFPVYCKTKIVEEPVKSADGRMVKYSRIKIHVSGWLTQTDADAYAASPAGVADGLVPGLPLDAFMLYVRRKLQVNQKQLQFVSKGYGLDLNVNAPAAVGAGLRDVAMGPLAGNLTWYSLGGAPDGCHGAGFEWDVSTCIAECARFNIAPGVFVEIAFTVTFDQDEAGLITISYNGTCQIPMSLNPGPGPGTGLLDFNIDSQISAIFGPVSVGYLRRVNRQLSADRCTCTFNVTDKQMEVCPPPGAITIDMRYRVKQDKSGQTPLWTCSFNGTLRMSPAVDPTNAWRQFFGIVVRRLAWIRQQTALLGPANAAPAPDSYIDRVLRLDFTLTGAPRPPGPRSLAGVIPGVIEFEENLFQNESRFSLTFRIVGAKLQDIIRCSGLWRTVTAPPLPGAEAANARAAAALAAWTAQQTDPATANDPVLTVRLRTEWQAAAAAAALLQGVGWSPADWTSSLGPSQRWGGLLATQFANSSDIILDVCAGPAPRARLTE